MRRAVAAAARSMLAGFVVVASIGCEREERPAGESGPAERAGEQIDQAFTRAGEELNKMAERTGKNLENLGRRLQDEAQVARQQKEARRAREAQEAQAARGDEPAAPTSGQ